MIREDSTLVGIPEAGAVGPVLELASAFGAEGDWRAWQAGVVRRARGQLSGQGGTVEAVHERLGEIAARQDEIGAACAEVGRILRHYADALAELQARARALRAAESEAIEQAAWHRRIVLDEEPAFAHLSWRVPPARRLLGASTWRGRWPGGRRLSPITRRSLVGGARSSTTGTGSTGRLRVVSTRCPS